MYQEIVLCRERLGGCAMCCVEVDREGVVDADHDEPQEMGDESKEVTDEMMDLSSEKRSEAQAALSDGS